MKENFKKHSEYYVPVRLSHLLTYASVGAVVRGPNCLLTIKDIRFWKKGELIQYVEQVKTALGLKQKLYTPPYGENQFIPATIFPKWMHCNSCGKLYFAPWKDNQHQYSFSTLCCSCGHILQQVNIVQVTEQGYMGDVDWHRLAHRFAKSKQESQCGIRYGESYLILKFRGKSQFDVECSICKAKGEYSVGQFGLQNKGGMLLPFYGKIQPWTQENVEKTEEGYPLSELLEINDVRLHSALSIRAIVIPPESRRKKGSILDKLYSNPEKVNRLKQARSPALRQRELFILAREFNCDNEELEKALVALDNENLMSDNLTEGQLFEREYQAFLTPIDDLKDNEDFVTNHLTENWKTYSSSLNNETKAYKITQLINQVISVERLREIWILTGFQRPLCENARIIPADLDNSSDWLPAIELYGEGIFLQINPDILEEWEANDSVIARTLNIKKRFDRAELNQRTFDGQNLNVTPRFMLLHALSHKIIKALEKKSGYSSASLRERIYCSTLPELSMSGILIYTSIADIAGTLGGLAEIAQPKYLLGLLTDALESADWCSLDPICSESEGQGPHLLNKAACHSCQLLPETSCSYGNILLDRVFICGNNEIPSILSFIK